MALSITFTVKQPTIVINRGKQSYPYEDELATLRDHVGVFVLVEKFDTGTMAENKSEGAKLAGKINRRMRKVFPHEGWTARVWPLPDDNGTPMVGEHAPMGVWVRYHESVNPDQTTTNVSDDQVTETSDVSKARAAKAA